MCWFLTGEPHSSRSNGCNACGAFGHHVGRGATVVRDRRRAS